MGPSKRSRRLLRSNPGYDDQPCTASACIRDTSGTNVRRCGLKGAHGAPMTRLGHCDTLRLRPWALLGGLGGAIALSLALSTAAAVAAEGAGSEPSEVIFFAQLVVLMLAGRLLGEAMTRVGQPSVMGMLLAGILIGPSVLGVLWPDLQHAIFPRTPA